MNAMNDTTDLIGLIGIVSFAIMFAICFAGMAYTSIKGI